MAKVYVFLADGFEDVEALIPVDVLRRGGQDVVTVKSAHGVTMIADTWIGDCDLTDADLLLLPGGMPGASNLYACEPLRQALVNQQEEGKMIAAICASPAIVLGQMGLLQGYRATCYPGFEQLLSGAEYTGELCTVDGNIITGEGPAAAFPFAYALLAILQDEATAQQIADGMRYTHLMAEGR